MKDYDEYLDDRLDGMYSILESSNNELMEGFFQKLKERHAAKKAAKADKKRKQYLELYKLLGKCEVPQAEDDFDDVVDRFMSVIKREIPGAAFNRRRIEHSTKDLGEGYTVHEYKLELITLNDRMQRKFISTGNNKMLKGLLAASDAAKVARVAKKAYDTYDYYRPKTEEELEKEKRDAPKKAAVDLAINVVDDFTDIEPHFNDEILDRLFKPMMAFGFENVEDQFIILYKDRKDFITIDYDYDYTFKVTMIYIINENEVINEGFLANLKEKRAAKKAAKEEKRNQQMLRDLLIVDEKKFPQYEKEFDSLVKYMISILKREVPGCTFASQEVHHSEKNITGHVIHRFSLGLFDLTDENFKKFISKSKNPELKEAENTWGCVDELIQDTFERIGKPLESKGYSYDENRVYSKDQGGKEYIFVDLGDEAAFDVYLYMDIVVKKDEE